MRVAQRNVRSPRILIQSDPRFSAEAIHELKTPLSLVRLHAEKLLVDEDLTPEQQEAVQVQIDEISQLEQIIEDLLFLSRAEARAVKLALRPVLPPNFLRRSSPMRACLRASRVLFSEQIEGSVSFRLTPNRSAKSCSIS